MHRLLHRQRPHEVRRGGDPAIGAVGLQPRGGSRDARELQDVRDARPGPLGLPDRAAAPLDPRHFRTVEAAPVAGALDDRGNACAAAASAGPPASARSGFDTMPFTVSRYAARSIGAGRGRCWRTKKASFGVI